MNREDVLVDYVNTHSIEDLTYAFTRYMKSIGAVKVDKRKKNNINAYTQVRDDQKIVCYYYKGMFGYAITDLEITMRKKTSEEYLTIVTGGRNCQKIIFETDGKNVLYCNKKEMRTLIKEHAGLIQVFCK